MHKVKLLLKEPITYNVNRYIVEKPKNYQFTPGQATELAINKPGWKDQKRPFTFTSLNQDKTLEFVIKSYDPKIYKDHDGMTHELCKLTPGDELLIDDPWGTINYQGPGVFIAGGAGITPFLAIFKDLYKQNKVKNNKLIFSNKTSRDIIYEQELKNYFDKKNLILTLTQEKNSAYEHGRINEQKIKNLVKDFEKEKFYVCGPLPMVKVIKEILNNLGVSPQSLVFEK